MVFVWIHNGWILEVVGQIGHVSHHLGSFLGVIQLIVLCVHLYVASSLGEEWTQKVPTSLVPKKDFL